MRQVGLYASLLQACLTPSDSVSADNIALSQTPAARFAQTAGGQDDILSYFSELRKCGYKITSRMVDWLVSSIVNLPN